MQLATEKISSPKNLATNDSFFVRKENAAPLFFQPQLAIGPVDDAYEREADAVADQVMHVRNGEQVQTKISPVRVQAKCAACEEEERVQRKEMDDEKLGRENGVENYVRNLGGGQALSNESRDFYESRFGYDFSQVKIHTDAAAAKSAQSINALAYTTGNNIVFNHDQYSPDTDNGKRLLGHELTHVVQQSGASPKNIQRREAPYIKKITVHLTPPQSAVLEWEGTPPASATGSDSFTVSTGKGYSNPGDPAGTCTRACCSDADTQCAPPWNQPGRVGACCTYYGDTFWTGTPLDEHNGWKWWTPIQPYYSQRGIALHQHDTVTGQPIGHGCVRMDDANAKRIYDFSNGRRTNVTIDGRAAPVECTADRVCGSGGRTGQLDGPASGDTALADNSGVDQQQPVEGMEGMLT